MHRTKTNQVLIMMKTNRLNIKLGLVLLLCLCFAAIGEAKISLPYLINNGMVLQRGKAVPIWGTADAGESVTLKFAGKEYQTTAGPDGNWKIMLPAMKAGGPYDMQINDITLHNILIGDVFLCSGQSNMELTVARVMDMFADEINAYENTNIHYLKVPYCYDFNEPQKDIKKAEWQPLDKTHVMGYSALCYFFAKQLYEKTKVPVGIINSSWGGTPIEAWISEEGLQDFPVYTHQKAVYESKELINNIQQIEQARGRAWQIELYKTDKGTHAQTPWYAENYDDSAWQTVDMFSPQWATNGWRPINGVHWFRQQIDLPASWNGKEATLRLGCIVDADSVYVNGKFVGSVAYQYPPRIYNIPKGLLKTGKNQITIRLMSNGGLPSFVKDKPYKLICGTEETNLSQQWKHRIGTEMPQAPSSTAFQNMPIGLYNGMIAPLRNYVFKGTVWYQGESNTGKWKEYASLLKSLMKDWRKTFGMPEMPFYIMELADFMAPDNPGRKGWAALQAQQAKAAEEDPHATLIPNKDTGEWNDIHPLDKKTGGKRLVEAVTQSF